MLKLSELKQSWNLVDFIWISIDFIIDFNLFQLDLIEINQFNWNCVDMYTFLLETLVNIKVVSKDQKMYSNFYFNFTVSTSSSSSLSTTNSSAAFQETSLYWDGSSSCWGISSPASNCSLWQRFTANSLPKTSRLNFQKFTQLWS